MTTSSAVLRGATPPGLRGATRRPAIPGRAPAPGFNTASGGSDSRAHWVVDAVVEEARSLVAGAGAVVFRWDEKEQALFAVHQVPTAPRASSARPGDWLVDRVYRRAETVRVTDYALHPAARVGSGGGFEAVAVPLVARGRQLGCLLVWSPGLPGADSAPVQQLTLYGRVAGSLLDRIWHAVATRNDAIGRVVRGSMVAGEGAIEGPVSMARPAISSTALMTTSDAAALHWWDTETSQLRSYAGVAHGRVTARTCPANGASSTAFNLGRPMVVNDYSSWPSELPATADGVMQRMAAVPIVMRDRILGVLSVYRHSPVDFSSEDVERLHLMAGLIGPALEASIMDTARRERQELMDMVLTNAPLVCGVLNHDGIVTIGGGAGLDLIGISPAYFIGTSVFERYANNPELLDGVRKALAGTRSRLEMTSSVSGHAWEARLDPILDRHGAVSGASMILIDLTERLRAQQARRESDAKSQFLTTISHELRTPLNSILGFSELLGRTTLDERQDRYVGNISTSGRHLLSLINDLLDMAKIQSGQLEVASGPVDVRGVVRDAVELVSPLARGGQLRLSTRCGRGVVARGDARRIHQVVVNLLGNAVKFTPAGGLIGVTSRNVGTFAEIRVSDSGVGVPVQDRERIFEDFAQARAEVAAPQGTDRAAMGGGGGTGLGLPVSRRLAELMGGTLTLEPNKGGRGSVFVLRIPRA